VTSQSNKWQITASRCLTLRPILDPRRDMHRLHGGDPRPAGRTPGQEFIGAAGIGPASVRIADVSRKEFEEARAGVIAGGSAKRRECDRGEAGRAGSCQHLVGIEFKPGVFQFSSELDFPTVPAIHVRINNAI
jgi:hypothetical protein